jgi:hypothetical protein
VVRSSLFYPFVTGSPGMANVLRYYFAFVAQLDWRA